MNTRQWAISAVLLFAVALVGCSAAIDGDPHPLPAPGESPSFGSTLPPRPRPIRVDNLNPCSVFTSDQLEQLDIGDPRATRETLEIGPTCSWRHSPYEPIESYLAERVADKGAETAFGNPRGTTVLVVAGFPAIETQGLRAPREANCIVLLSVADGQTVRVQYDYNGTELPMTRELACEKARFAATLAMQTLIARSGGG